MYDCSYSTSSEKPALANRSRIRIQWVIQVQYRRLKMIPLIFRSAACGIKMYTGFMARSTALTESPQFIAQGSNSAGSVRGGIYAKACNGPLMLNLVQPSSPSQPLFIMTTGTLPKPPAMCKWLIHCCISVENIISAIIATLLNVNIAVLCYRGGLEPIKAILGTFAALIWINP